MKLFKLNLGKRRRRKRFIKSRLYDVQLFFFIDLPFPLRFPFFTDKIIFFRKIKELVSIYVIIR